MRNIRACLFSIMLCIAIAAMFTACGTGSFGHSHEVSSAWEQDDTHHWHVCEDADCEEIFDKSSHIWSQNKCTVCGCENKAESEFVFTYLEDSDSYMLTGCTGTLSTDIVIPAEYYGKPVTHVDGFLGANLKNVVSIVFPDSVTHIENFAFSGCEALRSVSFGTGIKKIGSEAFTKCPIEEIHLGSLESWCGVEFVGTNALPASVTKDAKIYLNGNELKNMVIPASVKSISSYAFYGFSSLETVSTEGPLEDLGISSFAYCKNLKSVTLNGSFASIGNSCFYECKSLESVVLPVSLSDIYDAAFKNCISLKGFNFPPSLKTIGDSAFSGSGIVEVNLPNGTETLRNNAFAECASLISVSLPDSILNFGTLVFSGTPFYTELSKQSNGIVYVGKYLTEVVFGADIQGVLAIADGTIGIADKAFSLNNKKHNMTGVILPKSIRFIGNEAFTECTALESVNFPDGLLTIGNRAFKGTDLKSIYLPQSVYSIGYEAFAYCSELSDIKSSAKITNISASTFEHTTFESEKANWENGLLYLNGILLKADKNLEGTVTVDSETTIIAEYAFYDCRKITDVKLMHTKSILELAFYQCSSLKTLYVAPELAYIGPTAFFQSGLTDIYFSGLKEQWQEIEIDESVKLDNIAIHCTAH